MLGKKTNWIWLSHVLDENTPAYGGGPGLQLSQTKAIHCGDSCNQSTIEHLPLHLGTHVDAPLHFIPEGKSVDELSAENWIFNAIQLFEFSLPPTAYILTEKDFPLSAINPLAEIILIKTGFEQYRKKEIYWKQNPGLSPELASYFLSYFPYLRAVGMDFISVSSFLHREIGRKAHQAFLSKEILLVEDMKLNTLDASKNLSKLIILPLRIKGIDGSPCTVIAHS